jgi:photosystem II stability/assembly factor-like uncharacterized protein
MASRGPLAVALALGLAVATGILGSRPAAADDWELMPLGGRVLQLFTPASGAFLARTTDGLFRSDDGGTSWAPIDAPTELQLAAVDPADHAVLYVSAGEGISKSGDGGASWTLALPTPQRAINIAVSPADTNLVYVALSGRGISADFELHRSVDGGVTWQKLEEHHNSLCGWGAPIFNPHPTDSARVLRSAGCHAGRSQTTGDTLDQSVDRGESWSTLFHPRPYFPSRLVGGRGSAPGRFYLGASTGFSSAGGWIYRTDDDGATWVEVLDAQSGSHVGGLAYDPSTPDRVYAGLSTGGVKTTSDGGVTWLDLGRQDLGRINDLALGIDAINIYAATDNGLWRLRLPSA